MTDDIPLCVFLLSKDAVFGIIFKKLKLPL